MYDRIRELLRSKDKKKIVAGLLFDMLEEAPFHSNPEMYINEILRDEYFFSKRVLFPEAAAIAVKNSGILLVHEDYEDMARYITENYSDNVSLISLTPLVYQKSEKKKPRIYMDRDSERFGLDYGLRGKEVMERAKEIKSFPLDYVLHCRSIETESEEPFDIKRAKAIALMRNNLSFVKNEKLSREEIEIINNMFKDTTAYEVIVPAIKTDNPQIKQSTLKTEDFIIKQLISVLSGNITFPFSKD